MRDLIKETPRAQQAVWEMTADGGLVVLAPGFLAQGLIDPDSVRIVSPLLLPDNIRLFVPRRMLRYPEAIRNAVFALVRRSAKLDETPFSF